MHLVDYLVLSKLSFERANTKYGIQGNWMEAQNALFNGPVTPLFGPEINILRPRL